MRITAFRAPGGPTRDRLQADGIKSFAIEREDLSDEEGWFTDEENIGDTAHRGAIEDGPRQTEAEARGEAAGPVL